MRYIYWMLKDNGNVSYKIKDTTIKKDIAHCESEDVALIIVNGMNYIESITQKPKGLFAIWKITGTERYTWGPLTQMNGEEILYQDNLEEVSVEYINKYGQFNNRKPEITE